MAILRKLGLPTVPFARRGSTARRLVLAAASCARPISRRTPVQKSITNVSAKSQLLVKPVILITKLGALVVYVRQVSSPCRGAVLHGKNQLLSYNLILLNSLSSMVISLSLSLAAAIHISNLHVVIVHAKNARQAGFLWQLIRFVLST